MIAAPDGLDPRARVLHRADAELGESPLWNDAGDQVVWTDIATRCLHVTDRTGHDRVVGRDSPVGALASHADGGYVLAEGSQILHVGSDFALRAVIADIELPTDARFNDGEIDPYGRFVVGVLAPEPGVVLVVDPDGSVRTVITGTGCTNGMGWSPDGTTLYYTDSATGGVDAFDYAPSGGVSNRRQVVQVDSGLPDGLAIDADGCLWVAVWGAGEVRRYSPAGERLDTLRVPARHVTCPAFGGPDARTLFITSARLGRSEAELRDEPDAGAIFAASVEVPGLTRTAFAQQADRTG